MRRVLARAGIVLALGVSITATGPAAAAPSKSAKASPIDKIVGGWIVARLDEWPDTCSIRLTKVVTIGGYAVVLGHGCTRAFAPDAKARSWTDDVFAWRPSQEGGITLADATRHSMVTFVSTAMGTGGRSWIGHGPDGQDYEILRDTAKKTKPRLKSDQ